MTKEKLVEIFTHRLNGHISDETSSSYDPQLVAEYINLGFNTMMWEIFRQGAFNLDNYTRRYPETLTTSGVAVTYDTYQDLYFSTLPVNIVPLPRVGSGVVKIQTLKGSSVNFVPMANMEKELLSGQEVDLVSSIIRYIVRGDIIEYTNMTSTIASSGVKMDLVIPFSEYDWDDTILIPSGQDERLFEMVVGFATGQPINDQIFNNQQDNKGVSASNRK